MKRTSKRAPGRSRGGYRAAGESRSLSTSLPSLATARDHEHSLPLARAKSQWLVGDWNALCELDADTIASHPERDRLALLVACAHQQRADHEQAREYTRRAIGWGCDPKLVARLLISGVHNTLGRVAALKADDIAPDSHFTQALAVTGDLESGLAVPMRAGRELSDLGLLHQVARLPLGQLGAETTPTPFRAPVTGRDRQRRGHSNVERITSVPSYHPTSLAAVHPPAGIDLLVRARTLWQSCDWPALASMPMDQIQLHPERAKLALLAAMGHYQLASTEQARSLIQKTVKWGCDPAFLQNVLLVGGSQSIARAEHRMAEARNLIKKIVDGLAKNNIKSSPMK